MHFVFVYGTLRRGERNHHLLKESEFVKQTAARPFRMYSMGRFPFILKSDQPDDAIVLELFQVDDQTLTSLDALEDFYGDGNPQNLYERISVKSNCGTEAWIYVFSDLKLPMYKPYASEIPNGDWVLRNS